MRTIFLMAFLCVAMALPMSCATDDSPSPSDDEINTLAKGSCGNGSCTGNETCSSCPQDCGACASCGDGTCNGTETCSTCASDCGACASCGDGTCNGSETCSTCASDCGACSACGDGVCGSGESCWDCDDCTCGCNGVCEPWNDLGDCFCPRDCGPTAACY